MGEHAAGAPKGESGPRAAPGRPFRAAARVLGTLTALLGFLVVNVSLTIHVWLPRRDFAGAARPSPDALVLFLLLLPVSRAKRGWYGAALASLALAVSGLFVFSAGEAVTLHVYERSFLPRVDLGYFAEFIRLLFGAESASETALFSGLFCLAFLSIAAAMATLLVRITGYLRGLGRPFPVWGAMLCALLLLAFVPGPAGLLRSSLVGSVARAFDAGGPDREHVPGGGETGPADTGAAGTGGHGPAGVSPGLQSPPGERETRPGNVLLFVVESYGYTAFAKEEHWDLLSRFYADTERALEGAGYTILSRFLESPVRGGYSWYADASLLTGKWIDSKEEYAELMGSEAPSMFGVLEERGYTTVVSAAGTLNPWPEGERFYGFDRYCFAGDFGYRGPSFSFVRVPDQFSVNLIHERFVGAGGGAPLFVMYMLVNSHAPFDKVPPYIEDWDRLGDGSVYREIPTLVFDNNWFQGNQYAEGYTAAVRYVLTVVSEYLVRFIEDETLVVVVGDHQPKYPVTGEGQPRSVPIHVISRDGAGLSPLLEAGYAPGLVPRGDPPHPGVDSFFPLFLELIDRRGERR